MKFVSTMTLYGGPSALLYLKKSEEEEASMCLFSAWSSPPFPYRARAVRSSCTVSSCGTKPTTSAWSSIVSWRPLMSSSPDVTP